jgi:hypothetical protein
MKTNKSCIIKQTFLRGPGAQELKMKNYKLLIINGNGALRAIFVGRLRRGNKAFQNIFFFSPKVLTIVRRTQFPFIIYNLSFIIYNLKNVPSPGRQRQIKP